MFKSLLISIKLLSESGDLSPELEKLVEGTCKDNFTQFVLEEAKRAQLKGSSFDEFTNLKGIARIKDRKFSDLQIQERETLLNSFIKELQNKLEEIKTLEKSLAVSKEGVEMMNLSSVRLDEMERLMVKNKIEHYKFQINIMGLNCNPSDREKLNRVSYSIENNLPIEKQLLYEVIPELFSYEIEDMTDLQKAKIKENMIALEISENNELKQTRVDFLNLYEEDRWLTRRRSVPEGPLQVDGNA